MNDLNTTARFDTGALSHTLIFGVDYDNESADLTRFANQNTVIAATPLLAPDPFEAFPGTQTTVRQKPITKTNTLGLYVTDTIDVRPAMGADRRRALRPFPRPLRPGHRRRRRTSATPTTSSARAPPSSTSRRRETSVYFSYGTSFNPSAENLALAANNQALPPEKDRTFEVGGKAQVLGRTAVADRRRLQHRDDQRAHHRSAAAGAADAGRHREGQRLRVRRAGTPDRTLGDHRRLHLSRSDGDRPGRGGRASARSRTRRTTRPICGRPTISTAASRSAAG